MPRLIQDITDLSQFKCPKCKGPVIRLGFNGADKPRYRCTLCHYTTVEPYLNIPCPECGRKLHKRGRVIVKSRSSRRDPNYKKQRYACPCGFSIIVSGYSSPRTITRDCLACGGILKRCGYDRDGKRMYKCLSCHKTTAYLPGQEILDKSEIALVDEPAQPDIGCTYKGRKIPLCRECPLPFCQFDGSAHYASWEFLELLPRVYQMRQKGYSMGKVSRTLNIPMGTIRSWCVVLEGEYRQPWEREFVERIKAGYYTPLYDSVPEKIQSVWSSSPKWRELNQIPNFCPRCGRPVSQDGYPDEVFCWVHGSIILSGVRLPKGWTEPYIVRPAAYQPFPTGYRRIKFPDWAKGVNWKVAKNKDLFPSSA